jgi:hypothetical protein
MPLTGITQAQYRREGLRYASDFTDAESAKPIALLPHQSNARDRPESTRLLAVCRDGGRGNDRGKRHRLTDFYCGSFCPR